MLSKFWCSRSKFPLAGSDGWKDKHEVVARLFVITALWGKRLKDSSGYKCLSAVNYFTAWIQSKYTTLKVWWPHCFPEFFKTMDGERAHVWYRGAHRNDIYICHKLRRRLSPILFTSDFCGKKCNKVKFNKSTSLHPGLKLHCLCFPLPAANWRVKILDGKFQKWTIPSCTRRHDELCAMLLWPNQDVNHSFAQGVLLLYAALIIAQQCLVLGKGELMQSSELPVVSGIHWKSWNVGFVEGSGEVMYLV